MGPEVGLGAGGWPELKFVGVGPGWEQWFLLSGDRHWDNPLSDWKLQRRHLKQARELGALVVDVGDFFCLMQGKYDPRASKDGLRPEHRGEAYVDSVVDSAVDFFGDYAGLFVVVGMGNHERAFLKRHETNVTKRFVGGLNGLGGSCVAGGVRGYVNMLFRGGGGRSVRSFRLYWHHGYGGGGPVTKNVIQTNRMAAYLADVDCVVMGHVHEYWHFPVQRVRMTSRGVEFQDQTDFVSVPTYKQEFIGRDSGFHHDTGRPPKPVGAVWLRLWYEYDNERDYGVIKRDVMMAS